MRFNTNLLAGLLLTGVLALAPANSFVPGGGGGGGGGHGGGFHGGFGTSGIGGVVHGFHGPNAQGGRGDDASRHDGVGSHHWYPGYYGY